MEGDVIGQILLYIMALGLPTAWVTRWLYRMRRKVNIPARVSKAAQMRRRDAVIKRTRECVDVLEAQCSESEKRLHDLEIEFCELCARVGKVEKKDTQLRQKLRARGVMMDV